jgi:carboxyl-terminal processing protease
MNILPKLAALAVALLFLANLGTAFSQDKTAAKMGEVTSTVGRMLEQAHYSRQRLNEDVAPGLTQARKALDRYLELLDYNRLFFTQQDIDEFVEKYGDSIQDDILLGNLQPAYDIYDRFISRVEARTAKINELLKRDYAFDSNRTTQINRDKLPWPADESSADRIWADRIEAELLQAVLAERAVGEASASDKKKNSQTTPETQADVAPATSEVKRSPKETIQRRYERLLKSLKEETREDQATTFLSALAQSYDPHSEYMSQRALDNFNIQMGLSLVGIGAVLRSDDGYTKIVEIVPGGPADRDGKLKVNDKIVAVAQGEKEFEDIVDMKLDRVVEKIRGKKGTTVRLQIQPAASADPSKLDVVGIVRDEVKIKDQEAKAQLIDLDQRGEDTRIGWITLPSFYASMNQKGVPPRSTTKDVAALLQRLKRENIEGLVIDLRRDSGGSLDEAIRLTGLFIPKGPVVQAKDTNGNINAMNDPDPGVMWDGPLIVLMNRLSASASEIFAAALQDYGRAVIVGDEQSFGKGTVQTLLEVDRFMPLFASSGKSGAVKLTIQKFYRIKGGSTQLKGVASDIVLPSLTDHPNVGEGSLKDPLEYDEVPTRNFTPAGNIGTYLARLKEASEARVASNPEFAYITEDRERLRKRLDENTVSLNKKARLAEIEDDKTRREARIAARKQNDKNLAVAREVTLDTVNAPELQKVSLSNTPKRSYEEIYDTEDPSAPDEEEPFVDPIRDETLLIMQDLIRLQVPTPITASAQGSETTATP